MNIIKGSDPIEVAHPVFMIIGQPGICKTSLAFSMRDPLLLDFDLGVHRAVNRRDSLPIQAWGTVEELLADKKALEPYASIIVDTAGRCLDVLTADIALKDPKKAPGGNLSQQGWGVLKTRFRQFVATVRALEKDLLIIAHDKEDKDGDVRTVRADLVGASYGEVMKNADFVGYLYMVGKQRILDFNPTDRWAGKNPAGWAPFSVPAVDQAGDFMAKVYAKGREALGRKSEKSADAQRAVEEWCDAIAAFTKAEQYNAALVDVNKLPTIQQKQIKTKMADCAKSAGITFDKTTGAFVDPKTSAPAPAGDAVLESMFS